MSTTHTAPAPMTFMAIMAAFDAALGETAVDVRDTVGHSQPMKLREWHAALDRTITELEAQARDATARADEAIRVSRDLATHADDRTADLASLQRENARLLEQRRELQANDAARVAELRRLATENASLREQNRQLQASLRATASVEKIRAEVAIGLRDAGSVELTTYVRDPGNGLALAQIRERL